MTAIAVPCPPPGATAKFDHLLADSSMQETDISRLIAAVCQDTILAAAASGGEPLIVPLELEQSLPGWADTQQVVGEFRSAISEDAETIPLTSTIDETEHWFEDLLGIARQQSDAASVGIVVPKTPLVQRRHLDAAAMRLRRNEITLGPSTGGDWYFVGSQRDVTLSLADARGKTQSILDALDSEHSIASLPFLPGYETVESLSALQTLIALARETGAPAAPHTEQWFAEVALSNL